MTGVRQVAHWRRPAAGRGRPMGPLTVALAALVAVLASLPLVFLLWQATSSSYDALVALLLRPRVAELLTNTVSLVVVVTCASVLLGAAGAWLTERTDLACWCCRSRCLSSSTATPGCR